MTLTISKDECINWLTLFDHISDLQVWVGEGVITGADRKRYLQTLMDRLENTKITL